MEEIYGIADKDNLIKNYGLDMIPSCEVYSPLIGKVKIDKVIKDKGIIIVSDENENTYMFNAYGYYINESKNNTLSADILLFPSSDKNYTWQDLIDSLRWRANEDEGYYYIRYPFGDIIREYDNRTELDNANFRSGNYFRFKTNAEKVLEQIIVAFRENMFLVNGSKADTLKSKL